MGLKALVVLALLACGLMMVAGCGQSAGAPAKSAPPLRLVTTVEAEPKTVERTSTQPATVHALHEARVFAKTSGYLAQLNVDIGSRAKSGDVLAVIDAPELLAQYEREQAVLARLEAAVAQAEAQIVVAKAGLQAAESNQQQTRASEQQAAAHLKADESEHARVGDLVQQRALADRLFDEATRRLEASRAGQSAAEATTAAAAAQVDVARAKQTAAEADLKSAQADVQVGRKRLEELKALLGYAELRAPFDGVILHRHVELGDLVRNSQTSADSEPLFVIAQVDTVRVRVMLPERDAPLATVGDRASITFQALPGATFEGAISRIAGGLDSSTRTMLVEIDLANPEGRLLPGMFGQATIQLESRPEQIVLPADAVRYDAEGNSFVYIVDQNQTIQVVSVSTGVDDGQRIEITAGLAGGEQVVGPLLHRLSAGQQVRIDG